MLFCNINNCTVRLYLMIIELEKILCFSHKVFASVYCFPDIVYYVLFDKNTSLTTEVMGVTM